ncbi:hypothetical protein Desaci_0792 [Desulfosporosinus acidiphilus SJ4]|uniref:Uncharacterized protein n=1 Tax=Desulfosporosinus acidiphilus (strain DSM 22704 / JCM 16185 / SJ4) TaxID=646529 RepID=I4D228_DESAJ|nr:hypothetical protein [Desulfosporosinus acidiphilus]AFM39852.1 hypothetical protein Desaci_0792 [Desulfosporosinus acidiphilus SJ4]
MKKGYKIVYEITLAIVVVLVITVNLPKNTTFKAAVLDKLNGEKVSSIEIIRTSNKSVKDDTVELKDPSQVESIINFLSQMKLRETELPDRMAIPYRVAIKTNGIIRFGLTLYDEGYIDIFELDNHTKDADKSYIITNKFDPKAIKSLIKE